nr:5 azacytidine induced protein 1 [Hymenolepis microstoma]
MYPQQYLQIPKTFEIRGADHTQLNGNLEVFSIDEQLLSAVCRIQRWWRLILQRRRLEQSAIRNLFENQKKRMLSRSVSVRSSTPLNTRLYHSPRIATNIMKKMKNFEPFVRNNGDTNLRSSSLRLKEEKPLAHLNKLDGNLCSFQPVNGGPNSLVMGKNTAELMHAIMADLEKLGAVQSELVLHNGQRPDESGKSAKTLQKINQLLKDAQSTAIILSEGENRQSFEVSPSPNRKSKVDQVKDSIKSLSEITYTIKDCRLPSEIPVTQKSYSRDSILTPRQLCPLRDESLPQNKTLTVSNGNTTYDLQGDLEISPVFSRNSSENMSSLNRGSYIDQFEQQLAEQRRRIERQQAEEREQALQDCENRLREEYDAKLEKNYQLIEQLIAEKKGLTEQYDKLVFDMRQISEKAQAKQKRMEENHRVELKKVEAKAVAGEKIKRERWEAAKIKTIKEQTAKSVERDIQRMTLNHKEEIEELKRYYKEQLEGADARASEQYFQKMEELRMKFNKDREEICAQERKLVAERYESLMEEDRKTWENLRNKLLKEAEEDKKRVTSQMARERSELLEQITRLNTELRETGQKQQQELEEIKIKLKTEHEADLLKLQNRLEREKADVEEYVRNQLKVEIQERELEMAEKLRKERDRQLEVAIQRLEEESSHIREEVENSAQERIKRLKEKYEKDVDELEAGEREAKEKCNQIRARCIELEGEMNCQTVRLNQLTEELHQVKATNGQLQSERAQLREILIREVEKELTTARTTASRAQQEAAEVKAQAASEVARLQAELNATKRDAAEELESLHQKIKEAIVKKDTNIAEMLRRHEKEVAELKSRLNAQTTATAKHNSYASIMNRELRAPGVQSNTAGNGARRGGTAAGKSRGASFRKY